MTDYSRYSTLKIENNNNIATISLNRPDDLNAIDRTMHLELEDITRDKEVNVVILTGIGKAFSSRRDVKEMYEAVLKGESFVTLRAARRLIMNLLDVEQPIVAAINGDCVGLAANMALLSDIIYAAEDARLGDPHVRIGLVAGDSGAIIWPLLAGLPKAKELLFTGDLITGKEAERLGIINKALPRDELMPAAMAMARRLANGSQKAIRWTKMLINKRLREHVNLVLDASLGFEFAETIGSEDHLEALRAFTEKRQPRFSDGPPT